MEVFLCTDFDKMIPIKYDFELPKDINGEELKEHRWMKKQKEDFMANNKVEYHLLCFTCIGNK